MSRGRIVSGSLFLPIALPALRLAVESAWFTTEDVARPRPVTTAGERSGPRRGRRSRGRPGCAGPR
jgi:hypothetical protein